MKIDDNDTIDLLNPKQFKSVQSEMKIDYNDTIDLLKSQTI